MMIVDMSMLMHRCYAKMDFLKNSDGVPTGLEFGTLRTLEMLEKKYPDQELMLVFDTHRNFRREKHPDYKSNRTPMSDDFYQRVDTFKKFLKCRWPCCQELGYEADDVMHSIASRASSKSFIYTNDHDLLQCVSENVVVLKSFKSQLFVWDRQKVMDTYGLPPAYLTHYFAFVGDPIDALPGVPRINKKYLSKLIFWCKCQAGFDDERMLQEVLAAEWGSKVKVSLTEFIEEGLWHYNFELMNLSTISELFSTGPTNNDEFLVECLKKWNIYTLRMCDKYREHFEKLLKDEEF